MSDGRRARGDATRTRVLHAARELFGSQGYEGTSIEAVLLASGMTRGALYHHFDGKLALFDAVAEEVFAEIAERTNAAAMEEQGSLERLRAGSQAWLEMAVDPAIQRIALLDPLAVLGWNRWRELDEAHTLGALRASLRTLAAEGRVPAAEAEPLAFMLLAALNEAALFMAASEDQGQALRSARGAVNTLLDRLLDSRSA